MKLKETFIAYNTSEESLLVPTGKAPFSGIIKGNKTLGTILELLKEDITEEQLIRTLCDKFEAPREVIAKDVKTAIEKLRKVNALDE